MKETYILGAPHGEDSITAISYHKRTRNATETKDDNPSGPLTYEQAITATGFGKYNYILLFITIPSALASICATTSISFIFSDAQCDLSLSLEDKGMLNAITYIGMISSGFLWGMIGDTLGRRTVLLYSYSLDALVCFLGAMTSQKWLLLLAKYLSGFVMSGPVAVFMCYVSEFHCTSLRPQLITILGVNYGIARTMLPLLAWWIMPLKLHVIIIEGFLEYKSWQIYLILNCIPSALAGLAHYYLPETPKFLMSKGRYEEAMEIFRKMYSTNTGNAPETLPFSELTDDIYLHKPDVPVSEDKKNDNKNKFKAILEILKQVKPLFFSPYLYKTFLMCGIMFGGLLGGNTLRLWLPQLFTTMDEYMQNQNGTEDATLCEMLDYSPKISSQTTSNITTECVVPEVTDDVYINNTIVPIISIFGYFIVAAVVKKIGKKFLLVIQYTLSGILIIANYWAKNSLTTVILSSLFLTFFSICATTATGIAVELFPTNMRTMATSLFLLCGRFGSILGNTLFPVLLYSGCLPPFLFIGGFMFLCAIFSLLLPGTENKPLE